MKTVAIVLNTPYEIAPIREDDIICADGGYKKLSGQTPVAVIGDFDSLLRVPEHLNAVTFPVEKNMTDGQLAVEYARDLGYEAVVLYGATGGKIEHILGNLGLLVFAADIGLDAEIRERSLTIRLISGKFSKEVRDGDSISLFPIGGEALVSRSEGLYYPLKDLLLLPGSNRGISNRATAKKIGLDISRGRLLFIHYSDF